MMNQIKKDLKAVAKDLKKLTQKTEKMIKQLEKFGKAQAAKKPKAKKVVKPVAKKATKATATDTVLSVIKRSRKGIDTTALKMKTGFKGRMVENSIYRLKKQGKIRTGGRGLYVKA
jgi:hypothetical protein